MNFIIHYTCYNEFDVVIETKKVRAINKVSGVEAQVNLEKHLKEKHNLFGCLIVHSCREEVTTNFMDDFFGGFSAKAKSPFNFYK